VVEEAKDQQDSLAESLAERLGRILAVPLLLILLGLAAYALADAILADSPTPENPGFLDSVLASKAVVAAVRIAIIFGAAYVVISVVALIVRRRWLTRVGPVQVDEEVSGLVSENSYLRSALEGAGETISDLEDELRDTNDVLNAVLDTIPTADEKGEGE